MSEEMKVIPIDLDDGRYAIEIPENSNINPHDVMQDIDEWLDGDKTFLILADGLKLTRIDTDDIQEET